MERLPITKETVNKSIHEVIDKENLNLSELENEIVREIVSSFPKTPTGLSFARWCKYTVGDLIKKIPESRYEDAYKIKNTIGKEIRYILESDEFDRVREIIDSEHPKSISPSWILKYSKPFFQIVNAGYRTTDGEVDWRFIADKLNISDQFKFVEDNDFGEKTKEVARMVLDMLEKDKPEKFNSGWIKKRDVNLAARILNQPFRDEEGNVDWSPIISMLPEEWKNRWESQRNMSVERVAYEIRKLDEKYNPPKINQNWLAKTDASLVNYMTEKVRNTETGNIDWNQVLDLLPPSIREKWSIKRVEWTNQDAVNDLHVILEKENPSSLNPTWIAKQSDGVYRTIVRAISNKEYASWEDFIGREFPEWRERYGLKHREVAGQWNVLLENILNIQNPDVFSPAWIYNHDPSLFNSITSNFRKENNEVDWISFLELLPAKWRERFEQRRSWTPEIAYKTLNTLLEDKDPEEWNPTWVQDQDLGLYYYLLKTISKSDGKLDWQEIIKHIDYPYNERWVKQTPWNVESITKTLQIALELNRPDTFSPVWIRNELLGLCAFVTANYRNDSDEVDWEYVIDRLPEEWRSRWAYKKSSWNPERANEELLTLLEKENPEYFHPLWITSHNKKLSGYILRHFRNEEGVDWKRLLENLPPHWQERWRIFPNIPTPDEVKKDLIDLLQEKKPKHFNPSWIMEQNNSLYQRMTRMFRTDKGFIDWNTIISSLPQELSGRWTKHRTYEESVPDTTYSDEEQVRVALGAYTDKLYTFYGTVDPEDKTIRDEICDILIRLAQKGNLSAEKLLMDNVVYLAFNWIEEKDALKNIRYHMADIPELIRKAIYRFNSDHALRKTPFAGYLFSYLKIAAIHKYKGDISLQTKLGDDGYTLEDKFGKYDDDDDDDVFVSGSRQSY